MRLRSLKHRLATTFIHFACRVLGLACLTLPLNNVCATELFVGGEHDEFKSISAALLAAAAGDVVRIRPGTYREALRSVAPKVTLRGEPGDQPVLVTASGTVLWVEHAGFSVENLIIDGQYGDGDTVAVRGTADAFRMTRSEVRHSGYDCIDIGSQRDVLIEDSLVHHCLRTVEQVCDQATCPPPLACGTPECRMDAHGIAAGAVHNLRIINTEIHTFSGDGLQVDADRLHPGWDAVIVDGCEIWLEPLPYAVAGFAAGVVPGENAIDTKTPIDIERPSTLTLHNTVAHGFRGGLVRMSAFNLKENVEVDIDAVIVRDSEIAFRIRGRNPKSPYSANVTISNAVVYDVATVIRYENGIDNIKLRQSTIGSGVSRIFHNVASHRRPVIEGRNVLVLGSKLPKQLKAGNNLAVGIGAFVNAAKHDYHLRSGSPAIDTGGHEPLSTINFDYDGNTRPWGQAPDIGAYEYTR